MTTTEYQPKPTPVGQQGIKDYPKNHIIQQVKELNIAKAEPKAPTPKLQ